MSDENRLIAFLKVARLAEWRLVPTVWNAELREALSDNLVTVGFGGVLRVTENGIKRIHGQSRD